MCGILGVIIKDSEGVFDTLKSIYEKQKNRGMFGCGLVVLRKDQFIRVRGIDSNEMFTSKVFTDVLQNLKVGDRVIMHHRYGTTGGDGSVIEANHPFINENRTVALIHNGHISNYRGIYEKLLASGHKFESEIKYITAKNNIVKRDITDSEVLLHLIEEDIANITKAVGGYAVAYLDKKQSGIMLYTKFNPIIISKDSKGNHYFSSELHSKDLHRIEKLAEGWLFRLDDKGISEVKQIEKIKHEVVKTKHIYDYKEVFGEWG